MKEKGLPNKEVKLGDILIKKGWITQARLEEALAKQKLSKEFLGTVLLKEGFITEEQLVMALSQQFKIPYASLKNFYVDWDLVMRFSPSLVLDHKCFPLREDETSVTFAITNPLDAWALGEVELEAKGHTVKLILVTESERKEILNRFRQYTNIRIRHLLDDKN